MLRFQLTSSVMMRYHTFSSNNWETMMLFFIGHCVLCKGGSLNELGVGKKKRIDLFCWERV